MKRLLLTLVVASASGAGAQELASVRLDRAGTLVRVQAPALGAEAVEGAVQGWAGDRLVVRTGSGAEVEIPRDGIEHLEFSTGRHGHPWWGVVIGAFATGIPAAVWWNRECEGSCRLPALEGFAMGALTFGVVPGFVVGSLVRTRNWRMFPLVYLDGAVGGEPSSVGLHLGPAPAGGWSAGLRLPLGGRPAGMPGAAVRRPPPPPSGAPRR